MSGKKPTLRHGLPYRWWRSEGFQDAMLIIALGVQLAFILVVWFTDWQPML